MSNCSEDEFNPSPNNFEISEDEQVQLKFFKNERSFSKCIIKNQRYSLAMRLINFLIKVMPCLLYFVQVIRDDPLSTIGCCHICQNHSFKQHLSEEAYPTEVHWDRVFFVNRTFGLWVLQIVCSILSIIQLFFAGLLAQKGKCLNFSFLIDILLEMMSSAPFIMTIAFPDKLRCLFVPSFLSCWIVKSQFENILSDINRVFQRTSPTLFRRVMKVISSTFCIIFTSVCGFQHLQRGGYRHITLFESLWFVVVTFSTVGYGDYKPDIWLSQAFMIVMIVVSLIVIPIELEKLVQIWAEKNKLGGTYSRYRSKRENHVVLCIPSIKSEIIFDFLNEFYSHEALQDHSVCILSPCEMDSTTKILLQIPKYIQRVIYIQGSALKEIDMDRAKIQDAKVCYILAPCTYSDSNEADKNTIMRSWAIKDFASGCPQCVQLYRAENILHIKFVEHIVCLDEFKYALLGNNIQVPGISTMVTLLIHTSRGHEGQSSKEEWQKLYGKCSGNEVYSVKLKDSKFFKEFEGKSFSQTSYTVYKKFGVNLVGILAAGSKGIKLNPGPKHIMEADDLCFYLSISHEQNSSLPKGYEKHLNEAKISNSINEKPPLLKQSESVVDWPNSILLTCPNSPIFSREGSFDQDPFGYIIDRPPTVPYIGMGSSRCHLMKEKRPTCCLRLLEPCEHCPKKNVRDYQWKCRSVIIYTNATTNALFNLIVPLRSHWISKEELKPVVILVQTKPSKHFLESISHFPLIFWTLGSSELLSDLLKAGIFLADNVVVMNKDGQSFAEEETLSDCSTIMTVQKIYSFFPGVRIITEIGHSSNMKFILFSPDDECALSVSKFERKERSRGSNISYMFRIPFAAGNVFSTNMLDSLLYQAHVKPHMISFFRVFLGINQPEGSGYISSYRIRDEDLQLGIYGKLYEEFIKKCKIPIGIYRTIEKAKVNSSEIPMDNVKHYPWLDQKDLYRIDDISKMINNQISSLGLPFESYYRKEKESYKFSFVVINPRYDLRLQKDDLVYLICPPHPTTYRNEKNNYSSFEDSYGISSQVSSETMDFSAQNIYKSSISSTFDRPSSPTESEYQRNDNSPLIRCNRNAKD